MGERRIVTAAHDAAGDRIDRVLARALALSRTRVKRLIETGSVSLARPGAARTIEEPSYKIKPGQSFAVIVPESADPVPAGEPLPLAVRFEDDDLIVIDKQAGLVVHPAPGNPDGTLVNALIAHCGESLSGIGGVRRPGIVHRLDKLTSGLMVAAKNDRSHRSLARQFKARSIARAYTAFAWGAPAGAEGEIEGNIGRHARNRKKMAVLASGGRAALTRWRVVRRFGGRASRLDCRLATGRTHQIRVHLAARGLPVIGDSVYGGGLTQPRGRALGAAGGGGGVLSRAPRAARPPARLPATRIPARSWSSIRICRMNSSYWKTLYKGSGKSPRQPLFQGRTNGFRKRSPT